jgi:hypothetical protein
MKTLLRLSAYLAPLVDRSNFAYGMSVFLVIGVGAPLFGALVALAVLLHLPMHPLFLLVVALGLALWFGEYAKRFAQTHKAEIVEHSQTRPWPRMSAVAFFVCSFLLFVGLLKMAVWLAGQY